MENEHLVIVTKEIEYFMKHGESNSYEQEVDPNYQQYIVADTSSLEELPIYEISGQKFVNLKRHDNLMIPLSSVIKTYVVNKNEL